MSYFQKNCGQPGGIPGLDLNVEKAWSLGYTGKGVTTAIMDDGVYTSDSKPLYSTIGFELIVVSRIFKRNMLCVTVNVSTMSLLIHSLDFKFEVSV